MRNTLYDHSELRKYLGERNHIAISKTLAKEDAEHERVAAALVEDVIHSGMLVLQRDNEKDRFDREKLREVIEQFVTKHGSEKVKDLLGKHLSDVVVFDLCFAEIRKAHQGLQIGKRSPEEQVWAAIDLFVEEIRDLHDRMNKAFMEQSVHGTVLFYDSQSAGLTGESGKPINPDAGVSAMARQLALTLTKLAFENDWFDGRYIVLPPKLTLGDHFQDESSDNSLLAFCWNEIEDASEELRFWGGNIFQETRKVEAPNGKQFTAKVIEFRSDMTHYVWEVIARRRFHQSVFKGHTELHAFPALSQKIRDPRKGFVKSLPEEFVSLEECVIHMILEFVYHLKVGNNDTDYKGLTLGEWVRGYSILALLAGAGTSESPKGILKLDRDEISVVFKQAGFKAGRMERFLNSATYQRGKRDLYDAPLLRDSNGALYFLASLFAGVNLSEVVASQLGSLGVSFSSKGTDFELYVKSLFEGIGIKAEGFTYEAEGKDFQCDLAVLWDEHLFIFECKNDFLPTARPMLSYYFWNDMSAAAAQVKRIAEHFNANRDIVKRHLGSDHWVDAHAIVLNSMPFSLPGNIDDVYFYDASALERLLKEGTVGIAESIPTAKGPILLKKVITKLWQGDKPTATDLIRQLENPIQLSEYQKRTYQDWIRIGISEELVIATRTLRSDPFDLDTVLGSNGFSAEQIAEFKSDITARIRNVANQSEKTQH